MAAKKKNDTTKATEKEILSSRKFSVAEAIGRANAGVMKGASPIPRTRQMVMELSELIENRLNDPEGSLAATLSMRLGQQLPLLDRHRDHPLAALQEFLQKFLNSETELNSLVRDTDARWGRDYQEKPRFNIPGQPDAPDDPYTPKGVRQALECLFSTLQD